MKFDAFGNINFKNITEDDMQEIESLLDRYFIKNEDNDGELNKENNRYLIDTAADLNTVQTALRELFDYHRDKIDYVNIEWKEDETIKYSFDDTKRSYNYSRSIHFLSEEQVDKTMRIVAKEESVTFASSKETFI